MRNAYKTFTITYRYTDKHYATATNGSMTFLADGRFQRTAFKRVCEMIDKEAPTCG